MSARHSALGGHRRCPPPANARHSEGHQGPASAAGTQEPESTHSTPRPVNIYRPLSVKSDKKLKFMTYGFKTILCVKNKKVSLRRAISDSSSGPASAWLPVPGQHPEAGDAVGRTRPRTPSRRRAGRELRRPQPRNPNEM